MVAVNKAITTIIKKQTLPLLSLIDYMICTLAASNKNPRVKQLILEKVETLLSEEFHSVKEEDLLSIFKIVKDKINGFIQKDTNANVRDAAVSLLTIFKTFLFDEPVVTEVINSLPKYRVTEIIKIATERRKTLKPKQSN